MILTADVIKLQCVLYKKVWELTQKEVFVIDCNKDVLITELDTIHKYLDLIGVSMLICRSLECKILDLLDKYSITYCTRDTTRFNVR